MPQSTPRIGTDFAGYRIESILGRGGMSVVYRAENPRLGNQVALKILSADLEEDEAFRERFVRESRLAASINNAHVLPVYDAGASEQVLYIAMKYVVGWDLRTVLRERGSLEPDVALSIVSQVGRALDAAHERDLVHRDVKPANILIERSGADGLGHVYLADFGLMKHSLSHSGLTNTGSFLGTVSYISPEQILQTGVDGRSDIYSLGCVLYESLTGRVPFTRETDWSIIHAHLHDMPPAPSEVRTGLPKALDGVVLRAMAKSPLDRYATCMEFAEATREALSRSPTSALSAATIVASEIDGVDAESRGASARPTPVPIVADAGRDLGLVQPSTFVEPDARPDSAHPADAGLIVSPAPVHSTASGQLPPAQAAASSVAHPILPPSPPPPTGAAAGQPRTWAVIVSVSLVAILAGISGYLLATRNSGHTTKAATITSSNGAHSQPKSSTPTVGQMNIAATFHAIPKVGSACQGSDPISCTDLPAIFAPQGPATASTLTVQPLMTAYDRDNAYNTAFQLARSKDPKLGGSGSGRCTGRQWEHENFWFHQPEHQSTADPAHSSDGNVFCYIDQAGNAVIVWSQAVTAMRSSGADSEPFLATLVASTKTNAFRYFFYVHHHIMM